MYFQTLVMTLSYNDWSQSLWISLLVRAYKWYFKRFYTLPSAHGHLSKLFRETFSNYSWAHLAHSHYRFRISCRRCFHCPSGWPSFICWASYCNQHSVWATTSSNYQSQFQWFFNIDISPILAFLPFIAHTFRVLLIECFFICLYVSSNSKKRN